jgi:hypothetical protein
MEMPENPLFGKRLGGELVSAFPFLFKLLKMEKPVKTLFKGKTQRIRFALDPE